MYNINKYKNEEKRMVIHTSDLAKGLKMGSSREGRKN